MEREELKEKVSNFIERYYDLMDTFEEADDDVKGVSIQIDETYQLRYEIVDIIGNTVIAIHDTELGESVLWYTLDEDYTLGDLVGGYLDLVFRG